MPSDEADFAVNHREVQQDDPDTMAEVRNTIRAGLKGISQRYINPVTLDQLAMEGLRGLSSIDPMLTIGVKDSTIFLFREGEAIADYPRPMNATAEDWAEATTALITSGAMSSDELRAADHERLYEAVFDAMLSHLDIFSRYAGAEEAYANRARRDGFGGIGIRFTKAKTGILITTVQPESPAEEIKLQPGDIIYRINEENIVGKSLRAVAKLLRGPVGSQIILTLARLDKDATRPDRHISFTATRAHIVPETVRTFIKDDVLQIRLSSFNKQTAPSLLRVLRDHQADFKNGVIKGVVLDVRDNPGGLLSQSVNVADLFMKKGLIITTRGRHPDSYHDYTAGGKDYADGVPVAVLIDANSASAAEIVASALQDTGRAVVIGSTSYGKGTVQTVIRLPNGGEITLTWSRFMAPSGYALHGLGVLPSFCTTQHDGGDINQLLKAEYIDAQRPTAEAWRAAGDIFDGRRQTLRQFCPTKSSGPKEKHDMVVEMAQKVLHTPELYNRAIGISQPISTASRP